MNTIIYISRNPNKAEGIRKGALNMIEFTPKSLLSAELHSGIYHNIKSSGELSRRWLARLCSQNCFYFIATERN